METKSNEYGKRLTGLQSARWKRWLNVQLPYRSHLRHIAKGITLDIGCGIGRNFSGLDDRSIGVDDNEYCVEQSKKNGYKVFLPEDFLAWARQNKFKANTLLFSHVLEHLSLEDSIVLINAYLPYLANDGRVIIFTPQEAGYKTDPTHLTYMDFSCIEKLALATRFKIIKSYSFPFPRWMGRYFSYNEFVSVWEKTDHE